MSNVQHILRSLPPYKGTQRLVNRRQDTFDIIREILDYHEKCIPHYNRIAINHWQGDVPGTALALFNFLRANVPYKIEPTLKQTVKTPAAILEERYTFGNDCKHYASYIVGVGEALARLGYPVKCFYRFGCYKKGSRNPGHVFAVFVHNGREIWIDPVPQIGGFDNRRIQPFYKIDKIPPMSKNTRGGIGSLYEISGIPEEVNGLRRRPAQPQQRPQHWLDQRPAAGGNMRARRSVQGIDDMGKVKFPKIKIKAPKIQPGKLLKKIKVPKIKIQPGKLLKKVALTPARNAFLALVKLNTFNLAVKMWLHAAKDQGSSNWKKLADKWKSLQGKPEVLLKEIKRGVAMHNKLHPKKKVAGMENEGRIYGMDRTYTEDMSVGDVLGYVREYQENENARVGVAAAAGAGLIAAAAPILLALANLLKSFGVNTNKAGEADSADTEELADKHNSAGDGATTDDGWVNHEDGTQTKAVNNPDGSQTMEIKNVPGTSGSSPGGGGSAAAAGDDTSEEAGDNGEVTKTKVKTKVKTTTGGGSFAEMMSNVGNFISDHKWWFMGIGGAIFAFVIIKNLARSGPKRRR